MARIKLRMRELQMKTIVLASNNQGKLGEFRHLFSGLELDIRPQGEFFDDEAEETGLTYVENAILKARFASKATGLPAIGDDSGLSVDHLGGAPGIYSARYAGTHHDSKANIAKLFNALQGVSSEGRCASYHCVLAYLRSEEDPIPLIAHGQWHGFILEEQRGSGGFGYDPVFFVPTHDCSAAELSATEKNTISHRAQAMANLIEQINR
jgi:XTP/dITP diphosphohydrolase